MALKNAGQSVTPCSCSCLCLVGLVTLTWARKLLYCTLKQWVVHLLLASAQFVLCSAVIQVSAPVCWALVSALLKLRRTSPTLELGRATLRWKTGNVVEGVAPRALA